MPCAGKSGRPSLGTRFFYFLWDGIDKLCETVNDKPLELNQAVEGDNFWQTNHNSVTNTYRLTYNIPLDGKPSIRWVLRKFN
jgi:hypothetical protein